MISPLETNHAVFTFKKFNMIPTVILEDNMLLIITLAFNARLTKSF